MNGRTLVVQPLPGIGDMVWHLPCLHAIAAVSPQGRVDVLTKPRSRADALLADDPAVGEVLWLDRGKRHAGLRGLRRLAGELRERGYGQAWVLHNSPRYGAALRIAGIPERHGFGPRWRRALYNRFVPFAPREMQLHPLEKGRRFLERAGVAVPESEPVLPVSGALLAETASRHADRVQPWIGVGIGASEPFKQWGADRYAELIRRMAARLPATFFLLGGPGEEHAAREIMQACPDAALVWTGALSVRELIGVLAQCRFYVGNDTGFLNIAAALGIRAVGLFGGSPPLYHSRRILPVLPEHGDLPWYGAPYMKDIRVEAVERVVAGWLSEAP